MAVHRKHVGASFYKYLSLSIFILGKWKVACCFSMGYGFLLVLLNTCSNQFYFAFRNIELFLFQDEKVALNRLVHPFSNLGNQNEPLLLHVTTSEYH